MSPTITSPEITKRELPFASSVSNPDKHFVRKTLLVCGIVSSLLYIAMNILIPFFYEGYSSFSKTVSELSAVDSPTRPLWVPLGILYGLLVASFGLGVRMSSGRSRHLLVVGSVMIVYGIIGLFWPPMHQREVLAAGGGTMTDTMHIVFTFVSVPLMLLAIGFGAASFGKQFRFYSVVTIAILIVFGILTGSATPQMQADLPTPWMGVWERISIFAYMVWVVVLAMILLRGRT